jgi:hypothetical protein
VWQLSILNPPQSHLVSLSGGRENTKHKNNTKLSGASSLARDFLVFHVILTRSRGRVCLEADGRGREREREKLESIMSEITELHSFSDMFIVASPNYRGGRNSHGTLTAAAGE